VNKDLKFLTHILESAHFIIKWTEGVSFEKFLLVIITPMEVADEV